MMRFNPVFRNAVEDFADQHCFGSAVRRELRELALIVRNLVLEEAAKVCDDREESHRVTSLHLGKDGLDTGTVHQSMREARKCARDVRELK